jgi:hypothetical protein
MKWCLFIFLLTGCHTAIESVPGVYVRSSVNAFGIEYDTLQVSLIHEAADEFSITRRLKYIREKDTIYTMQRSFAKFYPFDHRLHDAIRGKDYFIDMRNGTITDGKVIYSRY